MIRIAYEKVLEPGNLRIIKETVNGDGVLIYPTDTLYGLGGNFLSPRAHAAVDEIKRRGDMPYSAAVSGRAMLERLTGSVPDFFHQWYQRLLPGKFTFLFTASPDLEPSLLKGSSKIGIRVPDLPLLLELIQRLDTPLITTSVNRSGEPSINDPVEIEALFSTLPGPINQPATAPPVLIDKGPLPPSGGSTILDLTRTPVKCLRRGDQYHKVKELLDQDLLE